MVLRTVVVPLLEELELEPEAEPVERLTVVVPEELVLPVLPEVEELPVVLRTVVWLPVLEVPLEVLLPVLLRLVT